MDRLLLEFGGILSGHSANPSLAEVGTKPRTLQSPPVARADRAKQLTDAEKIRQQQENARLKEERNILRKMAKYFMEETNW